MNGTRSGQNITRKYRSRIKDQHIDITYARNNGPIDLNQALQFVLDFLSAQAFPANVNDTNYVKMMLLECRNDEDEHCRCIKQFWLIAQQLSK